jgi:hypothetical protein
MLWVTAQMACAAVQENHVAERSTTRVAAHGGISEFSESKYQDRVGP